MTETYIEIEKIANKAILRLNRPNKRNALNIAFFDELKAKIDFLQNDSDIRVIFITGTELEGKEFFCSGIDVNEVYAMRTSATNTSSEEFHTLALRLQDAFNAIEHCDKSVIAVINGYCYGAGLELALACDFRIATEDAQIGLLETSLGIIPDIGGTTRLVRQIGIKSKQFIMLAEIVSGTRAKELGIIDYVVPKENLWIMAHDIGDKLLKNAPKAVAYAKKLVSEIYGKNLSDSLALERNAQADLIVTDDVVEGFQARIEHRQPRFQGK